MPDQSHRAFLDERLQNADSAWRYSLLFSPTRMQNGLRSIYVFYLELEQILFHSSDPDLRVARLAWWQQELDAAARGQPNHPVTQSGLPNEALQTMKAALNEEKTGGALFAAVQQLSGRKPDDAVFDAGQRWYQLRRARLRGKPVDDTPAADSRDGLIRPLAILTEHTRRYDLDKAGFGPLLFAWQVARRSSA